MQVFLIIVIVAFIMYRIYKSVSRNSESRNETEQVMVQLTDQISKNPSSPRFYFLRGAGYQRLGNYRLAIADYNKAFDLNIDNESFEFIGSSSTFNNHLILKNRSSAKSSIGDKRGAAIDMELAMQYA